MFRLTSLLTLIIFSLYLGPAASAEQANEARGLYEGCETNAIRVVALVSQETSSQARQQGEARFKGDDRVEVFEKGKERGIQLYNATLSNNSAGDYKIRGYVKTDDVNADQVLSINYRNGTQGEDRLIGYFITPEGERYDLSSVKCSIDQLIQIRSE